MKESPESTRHTTRKGLYVLIPGFGAPHLDHKLAILENNLGVLNDLVDAALFPDIYLTLCIYDTDPETLTRVHEKIHTCLSPTVRCTIHKAPGIVGEFMLRHAAPESLEAAGITHCFLLLDDVELTRKSWDWTKWTTDYDRFHLNLLSPSMTRDSKYLFAYMLHHPAPACGDRIAITSAAEMFCYYMDMPTWRRYYAELSPNLPLLWGIDLVLTKHLGFRVGVSHYATFKHHYQTVPTDDDTTRHRFQQMQTYLKKFGETQESLSHQPAVLEDILIYHRR
jgi:hypothetical protein